MTAEKGASESQPQEERQPSDERRRNRCEGEGKDRSPPKGKGADMGQDVHAARRPGDTEDVCEASPTQPRTAPQSGDEIDESEARHQKEDDPSQPLSGAETHGGLAVFTAKRVGPIRRYRPSAVRKKTVTACGPPASGPRRNVARKPARSHGPIHFTAASTSGRG